MLVRCDYAIGCPNKICHYRKWNEKLSSNPEIHNFACSFRVKDKITQVTVKSK